MLISVCIDEAVLYIDKHINSRKPIPESIILVVMPHLCRTEQSRYLSILHLAQDRERYPESPKDGAYECHLVTSGAKQMPAWEFHILCLEHNRRAFRLQIYPAYPLKYMDLMWPRFSGFELIFHYSEIQCFVPQTTPSLRI
ncbi:hypothetical protein CEXT_587591 [Caerostris extrusa]|uniref:Uncharacterized protein n=1 Tax=Caerostris extrusa TaxID=172846 RepID=A0AAV4R5E7_CAEEX|nr:hypothetical protein CEXT_587591 [Caerostris extrusa]